MDSLFVAFIAKDRGDIVVTGKARLVIDEEVFDLTVLDRQVQFRELRAIGEFFVMGTLATLIPVPNSKAQLLCFALALF